MQSIRFLVTLFWGGFMDVWHENSWHFRMTVVDGERGGTRGKERKEIGLIV